MWSESGQTCLADTHTAKPADTDSRGHGKLRYDLQLTTSQQNRIKQQNRYTQRHTFIDPPYIRNPAGFLRPPQQDDRPAYFMARNTPTPDGTPSTSSTAVFQPPKLHPTPNYKDPRYYTKLQNVESFTSITTTPTSGLQNKHRHHSDIIEC